MGMGEFIGAFSAFLEVQTAIEEAQKMGLTIMSDLNVILTWFVLRLLLGLMFCGCFVFDTCLNYY